MCYLTSKTRLEKYYCSRVTWPTNIIYQCIAFLRLLRNYQPFNNIGGQLRLIRIIVHTRISADCHNNLSRLVTTWRELPGLRVEWFSDWHPNTPIPEQPSSIVASTIHFDSRKRTELSSQWLRELIDNAKSNTRTIWTYVSDILLLPDCIITLAPKLARGSKQPVDNS